MCFNNNHFFNSYSAVVWSELGMADLGWAHLCLCGQLAGRLSGGLVNDSLSGMAGWLGRLSMWSLIL